LPRTEMRVETLDESPTTLLRARGLRDHMITILLGLDVLLDRGTGMDDDFWGLIRSELGRGDISCEDLPPTRSRGSAPETQIIILKESKIGPVLESVRSAMDHWMARGHSPERVLDLIFVVGKGKGKGMERAEVRGPVKSVRDALSIGSDGFSQLGGGRG